MFSYIPRDWFWIADDGRVFASAREAIVGTDDPALIAFTDAGGVPTPWPRDDAGVQSAAALQDVLRPYGLFVDLPSYLAAKRYEREIAGVTINGFAFPSDRETQSKLTASALFAQIDPAQAFRWKLVDGSFCPPLSGTEMISVAAAVGGYVNGLFAAEATLLAKIAAGTVTSRAEIDAALG